MKESKRFYNSLIKKLEDYKTLTKLEFYKKYVNTNFYKEYISTRFNELDEYDIEESILEYFSPIDFILYENKEFDYYYIEMAIAIGGPNIWININTRWQTVHLDYHWAGDNLIKNISDYYNEIINLYNINCLLD